MGMRHLGRPNAIRNRGCRGVEPCSLVWGGGVRVSVRSLLSLFIFISFIYLLVFMGPMFVFPVLGGEEI